MKQWTVMVYLAGDNNLDAAGVAKFVAEENAFWAPLAKEVGLAVQ